MRLLLDTHIFLWAMDDSSFLSDKARDLITDTAHDVSVSAASLWEISIKYHNDKLPLKTSPDALLDCSPFPFLPMQSKEALLAGKLPPHHKDPFDRMLVAQAMTHQLTIITHDRHIPLYSVPVLRA